MKIKGLTHIDTRETFPLYTIPVGCPGNDDPSAPLVVSVTIKAVSIQWSSIVSRRLPGPTAPLRVIRDGDGKVQHYPADAGKLYAGKPIVLPDTESTDYRHALTDNNILQAVALFTEATRDDQDIEWTTPYPDTEESEPTPDEWRAFYQARWDEIDASGLPMGSVMKACKRIMELIGVDSEKLDEAAARFS